MGKNRLGTQTTYNDFYQANGGLRTFKGKRRGGFLIFPAMKKFSKLIGRSVKGALTSRAFKDMTKKMGKKVAPHLIKAGTNFAARKLKTDPDTLRKNISNILGVNQKGKGYKRVSYGKSAAKRRKQKFTSVFD